MRASHLPVNIKSVGTSIQESSDSTRAKDEEGTSTTSADCYDLNDLLDEEKWDNQMNNMFSIQTNLLYSNITHLLKF